MSKEVDILYSKIPLSVVFNKSLPPSAKLLLGEIIGLTQKKDYAYASNSHYSDRIGLGDRTIKRNLDQLESEGYIRRVYPYEDEGNKTIRRIYVNEEKLILESLEIKEEREQKTDAKVTAPTFEQKGSNNVTASAKLDLPSDINDTPLGHKLPTPVTLTTHPSDINCTHKNQLNESINYSIYDSKEDVDKHENSPSKQKSDEAVDLSSKDNRAAEAPLSPPIGGDAPLSNNLINVFLREKEKVSYTEREYLLLADAYMSINPTNVDDAYAEYEQLIKNLVTPSSIAKRIDKAKDPSLTLGECLKAEFPLILKSFIEEKTSS